MQCDTTIRYNVIILNTNYTLFQYSNTLFYMILNGMLLHYITLYIHCYCYIRILVTSNWLLATGDWQLATGNWLCLCLSCCSRVGRSFGRYYSWSCCVAHNIVIIPYIVPAVYIVVVCCYLHCCYLLLFSLWFFFFDQDKLEDRCYCYCYCYNYDYQHPIVIMKVE